MMEAEAHFALVAARQLWRALIAFDGDDRLPKNLPDEDLALVRNALEHWDEPQGPSGRKAAERGIDPTSHEWTLAGPGLLGELVQDAELRQWGVSVYSELESWDPW